MLCPEAEVAPFRSIARLGPRRLPAVSRKQTKREDLQRMIEKMVGFITGAGRGLGVDFATDEPSHIHIPRRSRVARTNAADNSATWHASIREEEHRRAPTDSSAGETRDPSTALALQAA